MIDSPDSPPALDAIDRRILMLLQRDAALPVAEIAAQVGLSQTPCWKRIKRMEAQGIITARVALVDPRMVGLPLTAFVAVETADHSPEWIERFANATASMPEVMDVWRMAGDVDYLLRVVVRDMAAYDGFYRRLIAAIPLKNVSSRFAMEHVKASSVLPLG
jgi:Lrp/AsnC family transcriptional regulator